MGQAQLMAIGTWYQVSGLERKVTASSAFAALAQFVFW